LVNNWNGTMLLALNQMEDTMSAHTNKHAPLLSQITIEHGPPALLGELFLRGEEEVRRRGVTLSFASFDELVVLNEANRKSWMPLISIFHPAYCKLTNENSYCIFGRNAAGDVVTTQAGRVWDLGHGNFHDLCTSLRLFYDEPSKWKGPTEACEMSIEMSKSIRGRVGFSGAMWYRPDYRGLETPAIMSRISRAYAFTRWGTDYSTAACSESVMKTRLPQIVGHKHFSWGMDMVNNPIFGSTRFALFWMNTAEMLAELAQFSRTLGPQVDSIVEDGRSQQGG
jgi:hypothetical protein